MDIKQNSINNSQNTCMSICLTKPTNTQSAYPLFPQHFQHEVAEATNLVATRGLHSRDITYCGKRRWELQRAQGHPRHTLAREEETSNGAEQEEGKDGGIKDTR